MPQSHPRVQWWIVWAPLHMYHEEDNSQQFVLVHRIHRSCDYRVVGLGIRIIMYCLPLQRCNGVVNYCIHPSCVS